MVQLAVTYGVISQSTKSTVEETRKKGVDGLERNFLIFTYLKLKLACMNHHILTFFF